MTIRLFRPCIFSGWLYTEALFRIKSTEKILCLSFDDGPDPASTPDLLDILDRYHVPAVFFCSGLAAEKYPSLVEKIKAVSYTHLRAHETVLDLVCRLLLEKKKI